MIVVDKQTFQITPTSDAIINNQMPVFTLELWILHNQTVLKTVQNDENFSVVCSPCCVFFSLPVPCCCCPCFFHSSPTFAYADRKQPKSSLLGMLLFGCTFCAHPEEGGGHRCTVDEINQSRAGDGDCECARANYDTFLSAFLTAFQVSRRR